MNRQGLIFCVASLLITLVVCAVGFHFAAMPPEALARARTPVTAEKLPDFDLGAYGRVSGIELMAYWMENPPATAATGTPAVSTSVQRFRGC